jgi:hypothetical protein
MHSGPSSKKNNYARQIKTSKMHSFLGVAEIANRIIQPKLGKNRILTRELANFWPEIVGKRISMMTNPEKLILKKENKEGTLFIRVNSGSAAALIQPNTKLILDKVNTFLGKKKIKYLRIIQGNKKKLFLKDLKDKTNK